MLQLYQIADLNHGLMMVGPSGSGKSTAWRVLLKALENLEGIEGVAHVIDPKVQCVLTSTAQFFIPSLVFLLLRLSPRKSSMVFLTLTHVNGLMESLLIF